MKTSIRSAATAALLSGLALISGCGGGGAADPYAAAPVAPPLTLAPASLNVYAGTPAVVTITSGTGPFQVFSSDSTVLPVTQAVPGAAITLVANQVVADAGVTITVRDAAAKSATLAVTVKPSPLLGDLTVARSVNSTCAGATSTLVNVAAICSGETGVATLTLKSNNTTPLPNRQVRFDVVQGAFDFLLNQAGTQAAKTITVTTDQNGKATVVVRTDPRAVSQAALIRATDVTSGNRVDSAFTIVQATDGAATLTAVPKTYSNSGGFTQECVAFTGDYLIYGGQPPYTVTSTLPTAGTLSVGTTSGQSVTVAAQGGLFRFTSNAVKDGCAGFSVPISITDATGRSTTVTFDVKAGSTARAAATFSPTAVSFQADSGGSPAVAARAASCTSNGGVTVPVPASGDCAYRFDSTAPAASACVAPDGSRSGSVGGACVATPWTFNAAIAAVEATPNNQCTSRSVTYTVNGGTAPYTISASSASVTISPSTVSAQPAAVTVTFPLMSTGTVITLTAVDAKGTLFTATATCAAGA